MGGLHDGLVVLRVGQVPEGHQLWPPEGGGLATGKLWPSSGQLLTRDIEVREHSPGGLVTLLDDVEVLAGPQHRVGVPVKEGSLN